MLNGGSLSAYSFPFIQDIDFMPGNFEPNHMPGSSPEITPILLAVLLLLLIERPQTPDADHTEQAHRSASQTKPEPQPKAEYAKQPTPAPSAERVKFEQQIDTHVNTMKRHLHEFAPNDNTERSNRAIQHKNDLIHATNLVRRAQTRNELDQALENVKKHTKDLIKILSFYTHPDKHSKANEEKKAQANFLQQQLNTIKNDIDTTIETWKKLWALV
ncbi:MAG: hypothetical protein HC848_07325 [Limnobacter sp.]|nr:hypothetical protein [Limnobacter sp.]